MNCRKRSLHVTCLAILILPKAGYASDKDR